MKYFFNLFSIAIFFLTIISCTKNEMIISEEQKVINSIRGISVQSLNKANNQRLASDGILFENNANPLDWVGKSHNNCLKYVASNLPIIVSTNPLEISIKEPLGTSVFKKTATTREDKITFLCMKYFNENVFNKFDSSAYAGEYISFTREESLIKNNYSYFVANPYLKLTSNNLADFNNNFYKKLLHFQAQGIMSSYEVMSDSIIISKIFETDDVQRSIDVIIEAENLIIASTLDANIKTRQLRFLSILRNSIGYWTVELQDDNNPWATAFGDKFRLGNGNGRFETWRGFWKALAVGIADAGGGIAGGLVGVGIVSSITGGVAGALCSAAVDGIIG